MVHRAVWLALPFSCCQQASALRTWTRSYAQIAAEAASAAVGALQHGHRRVQLNLYLPSEPSHSEQVLCHHLLAALELSGWTRPHVFFDTVFDANAWRQRSTARGRVRCDVLGLAPVLCDDEVLLLVAPSNTASVRRTHQLPSRPESREPDAVKLGAVQQVIVAAGERPTILVNPSLEALLCTPRVDRPTRPMFLSDFEDVFFMAKSFDSHGDVCAVRRVFPKDWEIWTMADRQVFHADKEARFRGKPRLMRRARTTKRRPHAAEVLCRRATILKDHAVEARRLAPLE
ncbi:hypothetical protein AB1Y20_002467 [Prymnesium parvum]|uniref:DUF1995 domain-containing protein n=1 Tax=Prymnesium parvum TaxID=97485 RepID=A0AB34JBX4_PRYPA